MAESVLDIDSESRTNVGLESEALIAGGIAGGVGLIVGGSVFAGSNPPIWGGWSIGVLAAIVVFAAGVLASYIGYWRARHLPGQQWRLNLAPWKFILDATNVAAVHALIATIGTVAVFVLLSLSFRGVTLDGWVSAASVGTAAGLSSYWIYLSVSKIDTGKLSSLLVIFISVTTLTSMATASDPKWWEYHFSLLGTLGDGSAGLFNIALIIAGLLVTTFSLYLQRDIHSLVELGVLRYRWSARAISTLFIVMGLMLAGVGLFPLTVSVLLHNLCASGMAVAFFLLLLSSPIVLRGMPWTFFATTGAFFLAMVGAVILFAVTGYFNLTFFELVVFMIIFGWIATFIRFLGATVETAQAKA
ncbi:DUF998 domain-containing protein [Leifsonia sp. H3M29-4]|uniref:DUF998 domain-containing protein n=1 Tax=Salinibacterium metalliresistens TaxID=3031321 RepID=UPI0023DC4299|nr:DUF998 domain-containing protein [Salinibacterium metalliresistens]MDF1477771.1 DUF998 domain-containing protein [Salinibacterium metalliresistens]